jgi:hypothetical protein
MPTDEELQHLADVLGAADAERIADLGEMHAVGADAAWAEAWAADPEPDPDTDEVEHD